MNNAGSIVAKLGLDTSEFKADLKSAAAAAKKTTDSVHGAGGGGGFMSGAKNWLQHGAGHLITGVAGGLGLASLVEKGFELAHGALEQAHSIEVLSEKLGVGAEFLQRFQGAAKKAGLDSEQSAKAISHLQVAVAENNQSTQKALSRLGVSARGEDGMVKEMPMLLAEIADGLEKIHDPAQRAALVSELFGKRAGNLTHILSGGRSELNNYLKSVNAMSDGTVKALADAHKNIEKASAGIKRAATEALGFLAKLYNANNEAEKRLLSDHSVDSYSYAYARGKNATAQANDERERREAAVAEQKKIADEAAARRAERSNAATKEIKDALDARKDAETPIEVRLADLNSKIAGYVEAMKSADDDIAEAAKEKYVKTALEIDSLERELSEKRKKEDEASAKKSERLAEKQAAEEARMSEREAKQEERELDKLFRDAEKADGDFTRSSLNGHASDRVAELGASYANSMSGNVTGANDKIRDYVRAIQGLPSIEQEMKVRGITEMAETLKGILDQQKVSTNSIVQLVR